jgi:hypothetical protein
MRLAEFARRKHAKPVMVLCVVAALAVAAYRYIQTMPVGTGETAVSPDGRYTASIMDWTRRDYLSGAPQRWFEYQVKGQAGSYRVVTRPVEGPYFGSRSSQRVIRWREDSSAVDFVFPGKTLHIPTDAIKE